MKWGYWTRWCSACTSFVIFCIILSFGLTFAPFSCRSTSLSLDWHRCLGPLHRPRTSNSGSDYFFLRFLDCFFLDYLGFFGAITNLLREQLCRDRNTRIWWAARTSTPPIHQRQLPLNSFDLTLDIFLTWILQCNIGPQRLFSVVAAGFWFFPFCARFERSTNRCCGCCWSGTCLWSCRRGFPNSQLMSHSICTCDSPLHSCCSCHSPVLRYNIDGCCKHHAWADCPY